MQIEATSTPAPELDTSTPAPELDTETADTAPEVVADDATDTLYEDQSTGTDDGTPEGTTDDETRKAGLREADYTRKTQEVAETRKALETRIQRLDSVVQQSEALVQALAEEFQADFKHVDWGKLAAEDPAEYVRSQHAMTTRRQKLEAAIYRMNAAKEAQSSVSQESVQATLREEQAAMISKVPEWKNPEKFAQESAQITKYLSESGYRPEEVSGITDHRAVILARKAMLFDQMQSKLPKSQSVTKAPPPVSPAPTAAKGPKSPAEMSDKEFAQWRKRQIAQRA